jgi:hypothetical protein
MKIKNNKYILALLIVAIILIWGNYFLKVLPDHKENVFDEKPTNSDNLSETDKNNPDIIIQFTGDYRDPFLGVTPEPKTVIRETKTRQPKRDVSKYKLRGIINKTAIIEWKNNYSFLTESDSLDTYKILKITDEYVIIHKDDKSDTLRVPSEKMTVLQNKE